MFALGAGVEHRGESGQDEPVEGARLVVVHVCGETLVAEREGLEQSHARLAHVERVEEDAAHDLGLEDAVLDIALEARVELELVGEYAERAEERVVEVRAQVVAEEHAEAVEHMLEAREDQVASIVAARDRVDAVFAVLVFVVVILLVVGHESERGRHRHVEALADGLGVAHERLRVPLVLLYELVVVEALGELLHVDVLDAESGDVVAHQVALVERRARVYRARHVLQLAHDHADAALVELAVDEHHVLVELHAALVLEQRVQLALVAVLLGCFWRGGVVVFAVLRVSLLGAEQEGRVGGDGALGHVEHATLLVGVAGGEQIAREADELDAECFVWA